MNIDDLNQMLKNTLMESLGIVVTTITDTYAEATMPVDKRTIRTHGILHGGASLALAETLAGIGSSYICSPDEMCLGLQISANHISTTKEGDTVCAKASIIHHGRTTHIWNVDISSLATGKLISSVRVTNFIAPIK